MCFSINFPTGTQPFLKPSLKKGGFLFYYCLRNQDLVTAGNRMIKVVPFLYSLSTRMVPLCD